MKTFDEIESKPFLENLKDWEFKNNAIERNFQFKNFSESLAFIIQVGLLAEKANNHPEIWNIYNKVKIRLITQDADGITQKDFDLVNEIQKIGFG